MEPFLRDKTYVITGATSGIGLAVAQALARRGASVIGVGRDTDRCRQTELDLASQAAPGTQVGYLKADLSLQADVRQLARRISETLRLWSRSCLDGLINNAATVPFWQVLTREGFDAQWAVNHLAAYLLTMELLPLLQASPMARVVTVSSGSHRGARLDWDDVQLLRHYSPIAAYSRTKLGNILFTAEFNRRFSACPNLRAFAADPGLVNTRIGLKSNSWLARLAWDVRRRVGTSPQRAAEGILFLATEPSIQTASEVYWKNSRPKDPDPLALNRQAARQLWELSTQMCGLGL